MKLILLIISIVLFLLAAVGVNLFDKIDMGWIAMAFFAASFLPIP